jgi:hypothetical protein
MKLAIVSTTINGEKGYLPFDLLAHESKFSEVIFIIVGDKKSKPFNSKKFKCEVEYLEPEDQKRFHASEIIGWNRPQRRSIGFLRAIEFNPDYILTIDDDNIPDNDYFNNWYHALTTPNNLIVTSTTEHQGVWHNYLATADAPIELFPRGFPIVHRNVSETRITEVETSIPPEEVCLYQGISLGDPDIDAMTRIVYPKPLPLSTIKDKNYLLRNIWSPYNTQNTVLGKELFPLAFMWPFCGRMDDIYASYTWQKLIFNKGKYVHVGDALNSQDRGVRDMLKVDLHHEVEGYFHNHEVWEEIDSIPSDDASDFLYQLTKLDLEIINRHNDYFIAHLRDIESIL